MLEETWLADLIHESGNEVYIFDANSLALLEVSEAVRRDLQYTNNELAEKYAPQIMSALSSDQFQKFVTQLRTGEVSQISLQTTRQRKDGSRDEIILQLSFLQLQTVSALIAVSHNAHTEHPSARRAERLAQIEAHVPGLLFQMRQNTSGILQFNFLSQACHDLLGQPPEAFYANPTRFFSLIIKEDQESWREQLQFSAIQLSALNWEGRVWIEAWQDNKWISLRATPRDEGKDGIQWSGLMTNISHSKQQQEEILQSRKELAELSLHMDSIKEQERERIERDLHDDLGGNLSALKMMLEHVWKQLPPTPYIEERRIYLNELIDRSITSIHKIAADLRPSILNAGLIAALDWLAQEHQEQNGIPYLFRTNTSEIIIDPKLSTPIFRVVQEACNNIRKHAQASAVEIHVFDSGTELLLEVIDNGCGIDEQKRHDHSSFGLRCMAERVAALGGQFTIASGKDKGTIISIHVPLVERDLIH